MYGLPAINWDIAMQSPGNPEAVDKFIRNCIKDFNGNIAMHTNCGGRNSVLADWMCKPLIEDNRRQELHNFGLW